MVEFNSKTGIKFVPLNTAPTVSKGMMYFDNNTNEFKASSNGSTYVNVALPASLSKFIYQDTTGYDTQSATETLLASYTIPANTTTTGIKITIGMSIYITNNGGQPADTATVNVYVGGVLKRTITASQMTANTAYAWHSKSAVIFDSVSDFTTSKLVEIKGQSSDASYAHCVVYEWTIEKI